MKKLYVFNLIAVCLLSFQMLNSQSYTLTVTSQPYDTLVGGSLAVTGVWDDPGFTVPIGFNFEFFGETTNTLYTPQDFVGGLLATNLDINELDLIVPFGADLIDRGYDIGFAMSPMLYKTEGSAGSRVFTFEYKNVGFYSGMTQNGVYVDYANVQMRLYEASGDIEVHIGPYSITDAGLDFEAPGPNIGLLQGFNGFTGEVSGEIMLLDGNATNPTIVTDTTDAFVTWPIPENTVYRFSSTPTSTDRVADIREQDFYYPNPSNDHVSLRPEITMEILSPVQVINNMGEIIRVDSETGIIELEYLSTGIYTLRFVTAEGPVLQRISLIK